MAAPAAGGSDSRRLRAEAAALVAQLGGLQVRSARTLDGMLGGHQRGVRRGGGVEFAEHRDYAPGDDLRRLDWRAYARNDRLYVKQYEQEVHAAVAVVVDASASMHLVDPVDGRGVNKWARVQLLAAAVAWLVAQQGDALELVVCGRAAPPPSPKRGPMQVARVLERLAALTPSGEAGVEALVSDRAFAQCAVVVVLSDLLSDPAAAIAPLARLRHAGPEVLLLHTQHPLEVDFAFGAAVQLHCAEHHSRMRVEPRALRQRYLAMMAAHQAALRERCLAAGVRYEPINLGDPLPISLRHALLSLSRGGRA